MNAKKTYVSIYTKERKSSMVSWRLTQREMELCLQVSERTASQKSVDGSFPETGKRFFEIKGIIVLKTVDAGQSKQS